MKRNRRLTRIAVTGALLLGAGVVEGKSYYVELWGNDANPCSKAEPCGSLQHTIDNHAGKNDRVIVGPGIYPGSILFIDNVGNIDRSGLRLESTHGRNATVIENVEGSDVIRVLQPRVHIGSSRKGFTIRGASNSNENGVFVDGVGEGARIEGNRLLNNYHGIEVHGAEKIQLRNNIVESTNSAGWGIWCNGSEGGCPGALIRENTLLDVGGGISVAAGERAVVMENVVRDFASTGIFFGPGSTAARVKDNAVVSGDAYGIRLSNADGATVQGNISLEMFAYYGFDLTRTTELHSGPRIISNLTVENVIREGMLLTSMNGARVERNTAAYSGDSGIRIVGSALSTMRNNNSIANDTYVSSDGCDMESNAPVMFSRQFFGLPEPVLPDADHACGTPPPTGSTTDRLNRTATNRASTL